MLLLRRFSYLIVIILPNQLGNAFRNLFIPEILMLPQINAALNRTIVGKKIPLIVAAAIGGKEKQVFERLPKCFFVDLGVFEAFPVQTRVFRNFIG